LQHIRILRSDGIFAHHSLRNSLSGPEGRNNSAGIPVAYSDAAVYAFRTRVEATVKSYLEALEKCGIVVDAVVEREMLQEIGQLASGPQSLALPPGVTGPNVAAVQAEHARRMARAGNALRREAANRLRELKMKASRSPQAAALIPTMPQTTPFTIASVVKTLAELKALPMEEQAMLLLRRLVQIYPTVRNTDKFHKGNILLPNDNWQIAMEFPVSENMAVRQHLLGGPWNRLVVDGYLVDAQGQGFHDISPEGFAAAEEAAKPKQAVTPQQPSGREKLVQFEYPDRPVAFMSYSWETKEHEDWVLALSTRLYTEGGVNVILDKWHLRMGMQNPVFMERAVAESDFVLVVCTPVYAKKANERYGGVGYEAMIITGELAQDIQQTKFIPVLREGAWDSRSMPRWLTARNGADLRGNPYDEKQYDLLVMELHGEYLKPPAAGPKPDFSSIAPRPVSSAAPAPAVQPTPPAIQTVRPQNAVVYAKYETKGPDAKHFAVYVRPADSTGTRYTMDTSDGEESPEGSVAEIARDFILLHLELIGRNYVCKQYSNASGHKEFDLAA
jgi:hypothetical protein